MNHSQAFTHKCREDLRIRVSPVAALHFLNLWSHLIFRLSLMQLDQQYNEFKLRSIMSEHKKTITAISWCPDNPDLFASASADNLLIIWNVAEQKVVARLDNTKGRWTIYTRFYWPTGVFQVGLLLCSLLQ